MPVSWTKTDARGQDSFVEEYVGAGIKLSFDFGKYSSDFGDWPKDTKFEDLKINGRNARIGTAKLEVHPGYPYSTRVHIKPYLSMRAACKSEKEVALARKVFETIFLHDKKS